MKITLQALQSIRSDDYFKLFWEYIEHRRSLIDGLFFPLLPRHRKVPKRLKLMQVGLNAQVLFMNTIEKFISLQLTSWKQ